MNPVPVLRHGLGAALIALLGLGYGPEASAQSVTTVPVGAMSYSQSANSTVSMGVPLLRSGVLTGLVAAGAEGSLTIQEGGGTVINLAELIASVSPYYIEVVAHSDGVTTALVGERFEVDEVSTVSNASNVLSLDSSSALNTSTGSNFSSLVNYRITIRPHWTLASLFGTGTGTSLNASTNINNADQVLAWGGTSFSIYYFRSGTTPQWRNLATGTTSQDQAIIPPGVGIYFKRAAGSYANVVTGEVRANRFIRPLDGSTQLIANGYPLDFSPSDLSQNTSSGYVATTSATTADQLLSFVDGSYSIYYLRSGTTPQWRNLATGTTDHSTTKFYSAVAAVLYRPKGAPDDLVQNLPFSLN